MNKKNAAGGKKSALPKKKARDYFWMPMEIITDKELSDTDRRVYAALASHMDKETMLCCPPRAVIAETLGISVRQVTRSTNMLKKNGHLSKNGGGGRSRPSRYTLESLVRYLKRNNHLKNNNKTRENGDNRCHRLHVSGGAAGHTENDAAQRKQKTGETQSARLANSVKNKEIKKKNGDSICHGLHADTVTKTVTVFENVSINSEKQGQMLSPFTDINGDNCCHTHRTIYINNTLSLRGGENIKNNAREEKAPSPPLEREGFLDEAFLKAQRELSDEDFEIFMWARAHKDFWTNYTNDFDKFMRSLNSNKYNGLRDQYRKEKANRRNGNGAGSVSESVGVFAGARDDSAILMSPLERKFRELGFGLP